MSGLASNKLPVGKENAQKIRYISTSVSYTVPNDGWNYVINVNPSGATRAITLPAGKTGVWINIIDAGGTAGTFPITLVGTVDGVTTKKISSNEGSLEIYFNGTTWETTGSFDNFFTRNESTSRINTSAPDEFVANKLTGGDTGTTYVGNPSNFHVASAEGSVSQGVAGWGNSIANAAISKAGITAATFSGTLGTGSPAALHDGNNATWAASNSGGNGTYFEFLFNATHDFYRLGIFPYEGIYPDYIINDITVFVRTATGPDVWTQAYTGDALDINGAEQTFNFTSIFSGSGIRLQLDSVGSGGFPGRFGMYELYFYSGAFATTSNTFQSRFLTGGASTAFQLDTLLPKDDSAANITDGNILFEYSTDSGTTWSTQLGLTATKALGVITATSFWLRYEMVGAVKLGSNSISTASTYSSIDGGELKYNETGIQRAIKMRYSRVGVEESTTARTVAVADIGKTIYCSNAAATTITFPDTLAGTNFNFEVEVVALGAAGVTLAVSGTAAITGVTTLRQFEKAIIYQTAANVYKSVAPGVVSAANIASSIVGVAGKTTPVGADTIPLVDSENANALKELSIDNLKIITSGRAWSVKATGYTAVAGDKLAINTTSSTVTITLPAGVAEDTIWLKDYAGLWGTNKCILAPNGTDKIMGTNANYDLDTTSPMLELTYIDATRGWII